ncbi:MAG: transporter substrate-binding domain-containing protein [Ectothiorhodospiraceae bacterium]|nr:transporter substrate-binding domain-containing protein [Ectothiorhodospiraceae bacterium]
MGKSLLASVPLALFGMATLAGTVHGQDARTLVVAADIWCPYNCEPHDENRGYLVDLLEEVFTPHGFAIEYRVMPWARALIEVERGLIDGVLGVVRGNQGGTLIGDEPVGRDETVLVVRRGEEFEYSRPDDLDDKAIGRIAGYSYDGLGPFDAYLAVRSYDSREIYVIHHDKPLESLLSMLQDGRIDVFPENRYVANHTIYRLGLYGAVSMLETGLGDDIFVAFAPNETGERKLAILDEGVRALKDSGRFADILSRYGIDESN